jgi:hypothetical protein
MADRYKEGRDFEWVPMTDKNGDIVKDGRGGSVKTRRFFTKAEKEAMKAKDKPKANAKPKPSAPKAKAAATASRVDTTDDARAARTNSSSRRTTTDGGPRRQSNRPKKREAADTEAPKAMTSDPSMSGSDTSAQSAPSRPSSDSTPNTSSSILQNIQNKRTRAQDVLRERKAASERAAEIRANAPSFRDFFNSWKKENPSIKGAELIKAREEQRKKYNKKYGSASTTPNMAKGGMVKKGTRDYKKSGMFYKSGSPRGYK